MLLACVVTYYLLFFILSTDAACGTKIRMSDPAFKSLTQCDEHQPHYCLHLRQYCKLYLFLSYAFISYASNFAFTAYNAISAVETIL